MFLTKPWSMVELINHPLTIPLEHYFRFIAVLTELRAHFLARVNNHGQQQQHQGLPFAWS